MSNFQRSTPRFATVVFSSDLSTSTEVADTQNTLVTGLSATLEDGLQRPDSWQDYLTQSLTQVAQTMNETAKLEDIPQLPDGYDATRILAEFRSYTADLAVALEGWSAIRQAAQAICTDMLKAGKFAP